MEEKKKQFILGLAELTRKYGIAIGGCGCCGSPFLCDPEDVGEQCGYMLNDDDEINIDLTNRNHLLHVLRNPYGWNDHVISDVRLAAANEIERLFKSMRDTENQLIEVANFVGAKCGDDLPSGSGDTLAKAIIRKLMHNADYTPGC